MPSQSPSRNSPVILDHQKAVFDRLLAIGRACVSLSHENLPVRPRYHSLIVGSSGTGKTYLARAVADALGLAYYYISVSEWILLGCTGRGAQTTWKSIYHFLLSSNKHPGAVIFLDEVDKLTHDTSWLVHLRVEVFRLLDLQVPLDLVEDTDEPVNLQHYEDVQNMLRNRTFIIGAGAFQHLWEERATATMGFSHTTIDQGPAPDANALARTLPRELVNRFRRELLILPSLTADDYHRMLDRAAAEMPEFLRGTFLTLGRERVKAAVEMKQGCRFLEELMLDTLLAQQAENQKVLSNIIQTSPSLTES